MLLNKAHYVVKVKKCYQISTKRTVLYEKTDKYQDFYQQRSCHLTVNVGKYGIYTNPKKRASLIDKNKT